MRREHKEYLSNIPWQTASHLPRWNSYWLLCEPGYHSSSVTSTRRGFVVVQYGVYLGVLVARGRPTNVNSRKKGMESDGWCLAIGPSVASCACVLVAPRLGSWGVVTSRTARGGLGGHGIRDTASDESQG